MDKTQYLKKDYLSFYKSLMSNDPIIIVEDNAEDCRFLTEALHIVGITNPLLCFDRADDALKYLASSKEKPLVIISDINMPVMTGIEFKQKINSDKKLKKKKIPFVYLTAFPPEKYEKEVKPLAVQGHFKKPGRFDELIHIVRSIIESLQRMAA